MKILLKLIVAGWIISTTIGVFLKILHKGNNLIVDTLLLIGTVFFWTWIILLVKRQKTT